MFSIRDVRPEDAASVLAIYTPYVTDFPASFEEVPPSEEEMRERIRAITERYPYLVATDGARLLGYAYGNVHRTRPAYRWSVDVTVYVALGMHRMGVGRALYSRLLGELKELGYATAFAGITLPNEGSVGLHEAMGFEPIGTFRKVGYKFGRWHDVGWWQLSLSEIGGDGVLAEPRVYRAAES